MTSHAPEPVRTQLRKSKWAVESTAQVQDVATGLEVVVHTLARNLAQPFDVADLLNVRATYEESPDDGLEVTAQYFQRHLGLPIRVGAVYGAAGSGLDVEGPLDEERMLRLLASISLQHRDTLAQLLPYLPVPVLGSPPEAWKSLAASAATSPYLIGAGYAAYNDRPVLAALFGSTGLVVWFGKPLAQTVRDHFVERLDRGLRARDDLDEPDER